jgi:16S rRNA (adenine1518-N6/adenine1519-N6)-dimethyltransferase
MPPRAIAGRMTVRKRFGQHFLHDPAVIDHIVESVAPRSGEAVVEIGPGRGALTAPLLATLGELDVVEIDRELAAALPARVRDPRGLRVHLADALDFDYAGLRRERGRSLRLVGNLPYNVSTPLMFRLLAVSDCLRDMHFMLQREVVERIVAAPGTPQYGRLGVMLAPRVRATRLFDVGPGAFQPPPRVWSSMLRLEVRAEVPAWAAEPHYSAVVAAAFGQRRKMLRNGLAGLLDAAQIAASGVDPGARAATLAPAQFGELARRLAAGSAL